MAITTAKTVMKLAMKSTCGGHVHGSPSALDAAWCNPTLSSSPRTMAIENAASTALFFHLPECG
jgi:hypothetical protein